MTAARKSVADHLRDDTELIDWASVALFYSALHYVHSALADKPTTHRLEVTRPMLGTIRPGSSRRGIVIGRGGGRV